MACTRLRLIRIDETTNSCAENHACHPGLPVTIFVLRSPLAHERTWLIDHDWRRRFVRSRQIHLLLDTGDALSMQRRSTLEVELVVIA